jgi:alpha-beta hydrolase superfamily lysophospholipase/thiol-disulfide isomerase/thioredoxin
MNRQSSKFVLCGISAFSILVGVCQAPSMAQVKQTSTPQQAPSFLKQAGQMILDNAQKGVLHNVNQSLQAPAQQPQTQTPPGYSGDPTSLLYNTQPTTAAPKQQQAAPCRSWVNPGEKPVAILLCIHGLGLQSNSYEFFGTEQAKRGLAVYAIDVRGFGSWMKAGGKTQVNFNDCLADIKQAAESIRAANPGIPLYILGESMGGAIALRAASMYPDLIDGLISSVPAGERFNQGKTSMKVFLNLLSGFNLANVGGELVNQATQNAKLKSKWQQDPLARLNLTPQELIQFQDFMNSNHEAAKKLTDMPVLFVQGNGDQLVKPEGTWELFNSVAAKDKSFFAVPGEHLIFEEAQTQDAGPRDQNFRVISSWLTTKVGRRPGRRQMAGGAPYGSGQYGGQGTGQFGGPSAGQYPSQGQYPGQSAGQYPGQSAGQYPGQGAGQYPGQGAGQYPGQGGGPFGGRGYGSRMPFSTVGLEPQVQLIETQQCAQAISQLEQMRLQRPDDANVAALLGRAYQQVNQPDKAGMMYRRAMRLSRGRVDQEQAFNSYLLGLSNAAPTGGGLGQNQSVPYAGGGNGLGQIVSGLGGSWFGSTPAFTPAVKGRVYAFYANWADQCKSMNDVLTRLFITYGDRVDFQRVDIDSATADSLVEQFKVGPIPTVIFVAPNGQVSSTIIGESTPGNYEAAIKAISR